MPQATADALAAAYHFLRRVEHRIQYLDDQQTHVLPTRDDDLAWMARPWATRLLPVPGDLDSAPRTGGQEFDTLLGGQPKCNGKGCGKAGKTGPELDDLLDQLPRVAGAVPQPAGAVARAPARAGAARGVAARLVRLVQRTAQWLDEGRVSEEAALRMADWIEPLLRRESYLALLLERPSVHERLLRLLGAAKWPARYLLQHPGVIDELASDAHAARPLRCGRSSRANSSSGRASLRRTGEDDDETCSTCCAAPTTPRCSARWRATWKACSRSSRWPTT